LERKFQHSSIRSHALRYTADMRSLVLVRSSYRHQHSLLCRALYEQSSSCLSVCLSHADIWRRL